VTAPDDSARLAAVLVPVRHVLLDFDGPVCSVFATFPAAEVARALCRAVVGPDGVVPEAWGAESDPLALYRRIADDRPDLTATADQALTALEEKAVVGARPTEGADAFLRACASSGRSVWIVTNNATAAASAYLAAWELSHLVSGVFGRIPSDPSSMKPSPRLLLDAMSAAGTDPGECVFIGDAVRDVEAGHAAGVPTIGYANKSGKAERLVDAGARAVSRAMTVLAIQMMC
jgi:phosphoglycolate phosphatase